MSDSLAFIDNKYYSLRSLQTQFPETDRWSRSLEAHVWIIRVKSQGESSELGCIPDTGRERIRGIIDPHTRHVFGFAQQATQYLAAFYIGHRCAAPINEATGAAGKPYFSAHPEIEFNRSHSHNYIALAFTNKVPIGVDVEEKNSIPNLILLQDEILSARERLYISTLPTNQMGDALLDLWVRKESIVKASGVGLGVGIKNIETAHTGPAHGKGHTTIIDRPWYKAAATVLQPLHVRFFFV